MPSTKVRVRPARGLTAPRAACLVAALAAVAGALLACGSSRDVLGDSKDVRGAPSASTTKSPDGYDYVARRPLGVVALAEGRGLTSDTAAKATDDLADHLQACATELRQQGKLVRGAARVVAEIGDDGAVGALNIKVSGGAQVTANAILCLVAPLRAHLFPPPEADAGRGPRGIAVEATWDGEVDAP